jgi:outer membrane protein assembly factor BamA
MLPCVPPFGGQFSVAARWPNAGRKGDEEPAGGGEPSNPKRCSDSDALTFRMLALWLFLAALQSIEIAGHQRFTKAAIIAEAGLSLSKPAGKAEFDEACKRLMDTGFFESCRYEWKTAPAGTSVQFSVPELPAPLTVDLNVAGVDQDQLWTWLTNTYPLAQKKAPNNEQATQYYIRAVQRYWKEKKSNAAADKVSVHSDGSRNAVLIAVGGAVELRPPEIRNAADRSEDAKPMKFGKLTVEGLPNFSARRVRELWTVSEGGSFTEEDLQKFLDKVYSANILPVEIQSGTPRVSQRAGTNLHDVIVTFKGAL